MKKVIFTTIIAFSLLGINTVPKEEAQQSKSHLKKTIRPTPEQELQLWKNRINVQNSRIDLTIAEVKNQ